MHPYTIKTNATVIEIKNSRSLGFWGHGSRNKWQNHLPGDYHMNADDDDVYEPDCINFIREKCTEHKLYVFKMKFQGIEIWQRPVLEFANIGTPCGVYPSDMLLPNWRHEYGGDFNFYESLGHIIPYEFVDKVIYRVKDA
jgi:hypothetical protein